MADLYSGVRVHSARKEIIDKLYAEKEIEIWDNRYNWYENLYIVVKDETGGQSSALAKVKGNKLVLLPDYSVQGISPRNKEQKMAIDALMDDSVRVVVLTGKAGTGKTLLSLAASISKMEEQTYKRMILTRPMSHVGKSSGLPSLGALPGDIDDKFLPYTSNFMDNLEWIVGNKDNAEELARQLRIDFLPLQLIRGSSWHNAIIIADECQILNFEDMATLGTRVSHGSKIIIMGDLAQKDIKIAREKTGIYRFVNHEIAKKSPVIASIELIKGERDVVANIFAEIFEAY